MPDCYWCGCPLARGEGVRMNLVTGTGVRFHTGRMAGSSFGAHTGRRTVCRPCAVRLEAQNRRGYTGGLLWLASAGVGIWMLLMGEGCTGGILGLAGGILYVPGNVAVRQLVWPRVTGSKPHHSHCRPFQVAMSQTTRCGSDRI